MSIPTLPFSKTHPLDRVFFDKQRGRFCAKLLPGEKLATGDDLLLATTLGSCVSACLFEPKAKVGGMNHFMLPGGGEGSRVAVLSEDARMGSFAMEVLLNDLVKLGAVRAMIKAKLFGAGNVLPSLGASKVGEMNAKFAADWLGLEGIELLASDLGGPWPRKIIFDPKNGKVLVKRLDTVHNDTLLKREETLRREISSSPHSGDVTLF